MSNLVLVTTTDKLKLDGVFSVGDPKKPAVLFVHSMGGNFAKDLFVKTLREELHKNQIAFLAGNNRGSDDNYQFELLNEAHLDITAWIEFLINKGYEKIILVGHSAGTLKVVRYLFEGKYKSFVEKLILLAPIDPLGGRLAHGRTNIDFFLQKALEKIKAGQGRELISPDFDHDIISYQTFVSWYERCELGRMFEFCDKSHDFPVLQKIKVPTKIIVGTNDEYFHPANPANLPEAMNLLLQKIPLSEGKFLQGASHNFVGFEEQLVEEIINFICPKTGPIHP